MSRVSTPMGCMLLLSLVIGLPANHAIAAAAQPAAADTVAVTNARIYPVTAPVIPSGILVVAAGKIAGVGPDVPIPAGARVIDAKGRSVMPGLVESHSHMGMKRLWVPVGLDNNEVSRPTNAHLRAIDSIDTSDVAFRISLATGVTTVNITTGSQTPNGGEAAVFKLRGGTLDEMYLASGGMKFALRTPLLPHGVYPSTHMGVAAIIRERLTAAREYREAWEQYETSGGNGIPAPARDLELEALGRVVSREWVAGAHAQSALEMLNILRIAKEFDLDLFIHHGTSLVDVVEEVAAAGVPVSFGPVLPGMSRESRLLQGPVRLARLGGKVAFHGDHPDGPQYYLRHVAAMAVRQGMPEEEALKALTINPASLFKLDGRIGSLEVGKDADFVILSGQPLEIDSLVDQTFIDGREVFNRTTGHSVF